MLFFIIPLALGVLILAGATTVGWTVIRFVLNHLYDLEQTQSFTMTGNITEEKQEAPMENVNIGMGHVVRALQLAGFGHEEIMALREAMLTDDFNCISFVDDIYSMDWDDSRAKRVEQGRNLASKSHPTVLQMACVGLENFHMTLWDPYEDIDPYTSSLIPALNSDTFTDEGRAEWDDVLSARVVHVHGFGASGEKREPMLEIHGDVSVRRVLDFGNLLAGNCTPEQQAAWVQNPAVPANGYEWPSTKDEQNEIVPEKAMSVNLRLEAVSKEQIPLLFTSDTGKQAGFIGHLRGDFDKSGHFHHSWFGEEVQTPTAFKTEFDSCMERLLNGPLQTLTSLQNICWSGAAARLDEPCRQEYGMKFATGSYSYYLRLIPDTGTYNAYIYAYDTPTLEQYLNGQEQSGQESGIEQLRQ